MFVRSLLKKKSRDCDLYESTDIKMPKKTPAHTLAGYNQFIITPCSTSLEIGKLTSMMYISIGEKTNKLTERTNMANSDQLNFFLRKFVGPEPTLV